MENAPWIKSRWKGMGVKMLLKSNGWVTHPLKKADEDQKHELKELYFI